MNSRTRTGVLIAVGGVVLVALGLYAALSFLNVGIGARTAQATPTPEAATRTLAAVAAHDVIGGTVLQAQDVTMSEVPIDLAPRDAVTSPEKAIGRIIKADLVQGEMILGHNLADPTGQIYDIAYVLDERHVLMALGASDLMSHVSMIQRGDIVDILATYQTTEQVTFDAFQKLNITAIIIDIIQDKNATAANAAATAEVKPKRSQVSVQAYLVALDPQSALVIKYLRDTGAVFDFVLRAPTSTGQFQLTPVTAQYIKELYGLGLLP